MLYWRNRSLKLLILFAGLTLVCGFGLALLLESGAAQEMIPLLGLAGILSGAISGLCGLLWVISLWRQMRTPKDVPDTG